MAQPELVKTWLEVPTHFTFFRRGHKLFAQPKMKVVIKSMDLDLFDQTLGFYFL